MFERSDAFVALPGGIGTLEEVIEVMTWAQLEQHEKPVLIVNINGFWDPLVALFAHMTRRASCTRIPRRSCRPPGPLLRYGRSGGPTLEDAISVCHGRNSTTPAA